MKKILVTGGYGQLALCLRDLIEATDGIKAVYPDIDDLDITDATAVSAYFGQQGITHCINCAAYTAVDQAESEAERAASINVTGAANLASACAASGAVLVHISTDFVFDGASSRPYTENDPTAPLGVYGQTKRDGERAIEELTEKHYIIRTSWLYSEYGKNFVRTMLHLAATRDQIQVVADQVGTPTYAGDLAAFILYALEQEPPRYGYYHFSDEGVASWYDFAKAVFDLSGTEIACLPIPTEAFPTPARRPAYSVMDKSKTKAFYEQPIPYWRDSLKRCLDRLKATA